MKVGGKFTLVTQMILSRSLNYATPNTRTESYYGVIQVMIASVPRALPQCRHLASCSRKLPIGKIVSV